MKVRCNRNDDCKMDECRHKKDHDDVHYCGAIKLCGGTCNPAPTNLQEMTLSLAEEAYKKLEGESKTLAEENAELKSENAELVSFVSKISFRPVLRSCIDHQEGMKWCREARDLLKKLEG